MPQRSDLSGLSLRPSERRLRREPDATRLEALLTLSLALSARLPLRELGTQFVKGMRRITPTLGLGVCFHDDVGNSILVRAPEAGADTYPEPHRLFPEFTEEHAVSVGRHYQATLHAAADALPESDAEEWLLLEYARGILEARLDEAHEFENARKDARDLRRLQAQVIQAEKLASLGQIAAGVLHELNNPLTSIVAYTEYLGLTARQRQASADELERISRISEAAERILRFSRDLMAYARPAANVPGPVSLLDVIRKALAFCEHELSECGVDILDQGGPALMVRGVDAQLTQVFVNLFTYAAHAMKHGDGTLRIHWQATDDGAVVVSVSDSGVGIEAEDLERIFEPFYTTKSPGSGTGLGLSIVRSIVEAHGGGLTAESTPGKGSTFLLRLPAVTIPTARPPA